MYKRGIKTKAPRITKLFRLTVEIASIRGPASRPMRVCSQVRPACVPRSGRAFIFALSTKAPLWRGTKTKAPPEAALSQTFVRVDTYSRHSHTLYSTFYQKVNPIVDCVGRRQRSAYRFAKVHHGIESYGVRPARISAMICSPCCLNDGSRSIALCSSAIACVLLPAARYAAASPT